MAAVDLKAFFDDAMHATKTAVTLTASSTDSGYNKENVRQADLVRAWKPVDSATDEYLQVDGVTTGWLGTASTAVAICIAYDARGADQTTIRVRYDTADNPAGSFGVNFVSFTVNTSQVCCDYVETIVPGTAKRYYRLVQLNSERGGGTKCAKILSWAMYARTGYLIQTADYPGDSLDPYQLTHFYRVAEAVTASGL